MTCSRSGLRRVSFVVVAEPYENFKILSCCRARFNIEALVERSGGEILSDSQQGLEIVTESALREVAAAADF